MADLSKSGEVLLEVRDLVKHYPVTQGILFKRQIGAVRAVDGLSFDLASGETLGIVGESGCGKSTLAKVLMRLEPATSGQVLFEGEDILKLKGAALRRMRRKVQMVFQDPYTSLNPRMTVGDIIGEPYEIHSDVAPKKSRRKAVQDLLDVVGLNPEYINRYPHQFSGGQRQRIGIARSLALKPDLIICDEPVSALDVSVRAQILNLLVDLRRAHGMACLFVSHDLAVVRHVCDRVAVMYLGRLAELAPRDALYSAPRHPYTRALLAAVPEPDPVAQRAKPRVPLIGEIPSPANPPPGCRFNTRCPMAQPVCREVEPEWRPVGASMVACHFAE